MSQQVIVIGAGGHGQVVADILLAAQPASDIELIGYVDDNTSLRGESFLGVPVLGGIADLPHMDHQGVIIAIGNNRVRHHLAARLQEQGETFVTAIHPTAILGVGVGIGPGSMICAGVVVNTGTHIGSQVILNTGCILDHHNDIGDTAHIGPGARLAGEVTIGEGTLVGVGATILPQRQVGAWSIVGAGAVVTRNVPDDVTVVGVPAKLQT